MRNTQILVLAGPTATGKSRAALAIAAAFDGEIVGADSVQVYRGFDIGSAKPTLEERETVPHHLIDVIDPNEDIDARRYAELADHAIADISSRGKLVIVVGGTGLWLRALLRGLVELPPLDESVRSRLEADGAEQGSEALHDRLARVDPITAGQVHPNDLFRIVRALEVFEQTGTPLGELRRDHALGEPRYRDTFVVLDMDRTEHDEAVTRRISAMLESGWVDEARTLLAQWGGEVRPFGSVGYREVREHLEADVPLDETRRRIRKSTRTYARRQRTWFRSEPGVVWRCNVDELCGPTGRARIEKELGL
ncbi:MAG: tRNA (adenosine(37)-N6)-dimethylallyltransferase MiaA [Myxococcota bacterium]